MDLWLTLAILAGAIALFVTEKLRVDVVALLVMTALVVTGTISLSDGLSGFSNQAPEETRRVGGDGPHAVSMPTGDRALATPRSERSNSQSIGWSGR